ncbi:Oligopeptide transporter, OPT superfamily [Kalmanozyma brasiliensis GHG001]|uniref:Sexual differentiation process protein ISP4 n=1 Tax=Kalmanozyma brasiliensis (strain GHG001) TaxID=1365824 RepID=V5EXS2_KALBG|nr:Oligopeptide transporter, OPT superfamily [Kalmanozyma brasiliensis GHG001]EST08368.1 Oligopeptide transporter, OPT superfamily [Kalmanozyma brasiliensis GHG001]
MSSARPTTGRPTTGRPTTGRPTTGRRPGTRGGTANPRPPTQGQGAYEGETYIEEEEWDEEDEEEYESEDDGDVFAFVLPDLGPAPELQHNPLDPSIDNQNRQQASQQDPPTQQHLASAGPAADPNETYYYDEATGAVYDSQGRLVDVSGQSLALPASGVPSQHQGLAAESDLNGVEFQRPTGPPVVDLTQALNPMGSPDNRSYDSSSTFVRGINGQPLDHARSVAVFSSMDALPEADSQPVSRSGNSEMRTSLPHGTRDIGTTASGGISLDQRIPAQGIRQSAQIDTYSSSVPELRRTPESPGSTDENKFPLDSAEFAFDDAYKDEFHMSDYGQSQGLSHPTSEDAEVGARGVRMVELEMEMEEDSPYPEVRASVSNIDDTEMPVNTIRMWFTSFLLTILASGANMFFSLRYPAPTFNTTVVLLVAYPMGKFFAAVLPYRIWTLPRWLGGVSFSLNPGIYNIKEHTLTTIMANISIITAYSMSVIIADESVQYYNQPRAFGFDVLLMLSTQTIGFGLAGMCRRFLVWPASMIWPQNLVAATILNTLHAEEESDGTMTRFRFFTVCSIGAFVLYWIPGYLFLSLSVFNWVCWIFPSNQPVNLVFGTISGLGMSVLTPDWTQISYIGSPLITPWWAECNVFAGFVMFIWVAAPIMWFKNAWYQAYLPFNTGQSFDRYGQPYEISRVIPNGSDLDQQAYEEYSPLYLSTTLALVYTTGFAMLTSVLTHTVLYHGKALKKGILRVRTEEDDVHAKFMRHYPETPDWWYAVMFVIALVFGIVMARVYHTDLPIWGVFLSILIPTIYILPAGFVYAMTGQAIGTNLIGELLVGYMLPGKPLPNMIFKAYAMQGLFGGLGFVQDLKLGHYMKIPPRLTFMAQLSGVIVACFVQLGVKQWMFANITDLCSPDQANSFTCPSIRVFYTASLIWGAIGPARMFGSTSMYRAMYWAMLFGALIPIPFYLLARRYPRSWIRYVSWPVIFAGVSFIPPASGLNYTSWFAAGFVFQYLVRKYNFRWWSKYNFVLAAAMDSGTIVSSILIFFALILPKNGAVTLNWWGNEVAGNNLDAAGLALMQPPEGGFGGPARF